MCEKIMQETIPERWTEAPPPAIFPVHLNHSGTNAGSVLSISTRHDLVILPEITDSNAETVR